MTSHDIRIRAAMLAAAASLVAAGIFGLLRSSDARFEAEFAAAELRYGTGATEVAIAPSRIEVVARRGARGFGLTSAARAALRG